jgi:hypothetical protein
MTVQTTLDQIEAFASYSSRGGRFTFDEWMDTKGFTNSERTLLRSAWTRRGQR